MKIYIDMYVYVKGDGMKPCMLYDSFAMYVNPGREKSPLVPLPPHTPWGTLGHPISPRWTTERKNHIGVL